MMKALGKNKGALLRGMPAYTDWVLFPAPPRSLAILQKKRHFSKSKISQFLAAAIAP